MDGSVGGLSSGVMLDALEHGLMLLALGNSCAVQPASTGAQRESGGQRLPLGLQHQLQLCGRLPALSLGHPLLRRAWRVEGRSPPVPT